MNDEIVDLTNCPPLPIRSHKSQRVPKLHSCVSSRRIRWKRSARSTSLNHDTHHMYQQMAPSMPRQLVTTNATSLLPLRATIDKRWTPNEHEPFMMGPKRYEEEHFGKIAWHFVLNKSTHEIHDCTENLFQFDLSTNLCNMNFPFGVANGVEIRTNENNMRNIDAPNLFSSSHMAASETPQTLKLFPKEASFPLVAREKDSSNNAYGFQKQTCCASNFILAVNEIDLELHLGYKK